MRRFAFALFVLAAGCGQQTTPPPPADAGPPGVATAAPSKPEVPLDAAMGAILPADKAQTFARQCSRISPGPITGTWAPGAAAIMELEASLGVEIERQLAATSAAGSKPEAYYRQYAGLLIDGRPVIYVNGIDKDVVARAPEAQRDSWKTEPAVICDGGTITFGVEYDPATKTFSNFAFNGAI
ncbi:MAG: hypothetical protein Q8R02_19660 [Hyphomonadaceae bacterium]|nr:hypothetical protein [Hyphomonadaceae bacterium]